MGYKMCHEQDVSDTLTMESLDYGFFFVNLETIFLKGLVEIYPRHWV